MSASATRSRSGSALSSIPWTSCWSCGEKSLSLEPETPERSRCYSNCHSASLGYTWLREAATPTTPRSCLLVIWILPRQPINSLDVAYSLVSLPALVDPVLLLACSANPTGTPKANIPTHAATAECPSKGSRPIIATFLPSPAVTLPTTATSTSHSQIKRISLLLDGT